jgi:transglutaminase-like putative cysteine protease
MRLHAGCELVFESTAPTPMILMLRPRSGAGQWVAQESYEFAPARFATEYTDEYGNLCQRVTAPEGTFRISTSAVVVAPDMLDTATGAPFVPVQELPADVLRFLLPSRYCQSDFARMAELAQQIVGDIASAYDQVEAIRAWIQKHITYEYGSSSLSTSALHTAEARRGVCRDFAHLGITLCRTLSIPARMVVGYLYQLEPMDQHAWFEAFVGRRWYAFDATQQQPRGGRITIAHGRDAADVALATEFGPTTLTNMQVWVEQAS